MDQQDLAVNETVQQDAAAETTEATHHEETMQELLDQYGSTVRLRKGQILTGTVVGKNEAGWLINVGFKCEGVLPEKEYTNHLLIETGPEPKVGDKI